MNPPTLEHAPKTPLECLSRLEKTLQAPNTLIGGLYRYGDKTCLIGSLLTKDQLSCIGDLNLNGVSLTLMTSSIGSKNLQAMAGGLEIGELVALQWAFDKDFSSRDGSPRALALINELKEKYVRHGA